jgi:hypothetical protein
MKTKKTCIDKGNNPGGWVATGIICSGGCKAV